MGTKYADLSPSGYDANSPSDDGSITDANKVKWSTHITKIGDPLNAWIQAINDSLITFANTAPVARSSAYTTTVTDHLVPIEVTGTTTISLGDAATLTAGVMTYIYNADASLLTTVDLATGGDTLDGSAGGSTTLKPGEGIFFVVNAGADGFLSISKPGVTLGTNNAWTGNNTFTGDVKYPDESELTISSGAITVTAVNHTVDTESAAATDDLVTINGGSDGQILFLSIDTAGDVVHLTNGGNIVTPDGTNYSLGVTGQAVQLIYSSALSKWQVIGINTHPSISVNRNNVTQTAVATGTYTKVQFTTEAFDTNSNFDNSTNYRFTPKVAGKYLVTLSVRFTVAFNGQIISRISDGTLNWGSVGTTTTSGQTPSPTVSAIIDFNGTTDYVEFFGWQDSGSNKIITGDPQFTFATAVRVS